VAGSSFSPPAAPQRTGCFLLVLDHEADVVDPLPLRAAVGAPSGQRQERYVNRSIGEIGGVVLAFLYDRHWKGISKKSRHRFNVFGSIGYLSDLSIATSWFLTRRSARGANVNQFLIINFRYRFYTRILKSQDNVNDAPGIFGFQNRQIALATGSRITLKLLQNVPTNEACGVVPRLPFANWLLVYNPGSEAPKGCGGKVAESSLQADLIFGVFDNEVGTALICREKTLPNRKSARLDTGECLC
jgi:hypothetical protein